jgi:hypothetical protein
MAGIREEQPRFWGFPEPFYMINYMSTEFLKTGSRRKKR